jgi:hypothetical protein
MSKNKPIVGGEDSSKGPRPDRRKGSSGRRGDQDGSTGLERRRGPGRRLSDFTKAAEEGDLTKEQFLFVVAIDSFKKANDVWYPSWTDVLEVVRLLGYRKTMPSEIELRNAEDWRETPDAPSNVRTERQAQRSRNAKDDAA